MTTSVAIGASATVTSGNSLSVALGYQASAQHVRSVALGSTVTPAANDQVRVAARHMNYSELAADPAAPAADTVRVYAKDNGSGKTGLYARFATGAVQQIAIQP